MIGAIIGDIAGSFREFTKDKKYEELPLIPNTNDVPLNSSGYPLRMDVTDDTILSCATADTLLNGSESFEIKDFSDAYYDYGLRYYDPVGGYGGSFRLWLSTTDGTKPYNSCGNGSAMRVSPIGWYAKTEEECLYLSFLSASATHNHPEGIRGAQAVAISIFYARCGHDWNYIKSILSSLYLNYEPIDYLGHFDAICQDTMRLVWHCLDTTNDFESAVKKAVTIKMGDSDTLGAIVGSIAEALYGIPIEYLHKAYDFLSKYPELLDLVTRFNKQYHFDFKTDDTQAKLPL